MKAWIIIALVLVVVGGVMFTAALASAGWDFSALSTVKYETVEHEITEDFDFLFIQPSTADVIIVPSEDGSAKVVCYEAENVSYTVSVSEGGLVILKNDTRKWYDYIGISVGEPKITVYLPKTEYKSLIFKGNTGDAHISGEFIFEEISVGTFTGDVTCFASVTGNAHVFTDTGDITVRSMSAGSLELSASTGKITISDVSCAGDVSTDVSTGDVDVANVVCESFTSVGSTGDLWMENVIASGKMSITRSTGDVEFESCDAAEISLKTTTGSVEGSLLTDKIFVAKSSTGDVEVPRTTSGGVCEITTSTGDIEIDVVG